MGVVVGVEHVAHSHLADGEDEVVGRALLSELVGRGLDIVALAATQIDGLAQEQPLDANIGVALADLGPFAVRIAAET